MIDLTKMDKFTYMYKTLIIDKDPQTAAIATSALTMKMYVSRSAADVVTAKELINNWLPDMILLDLTDNPEEKFSFLHELRSNIKFSTVPVIVLVDGSCRDLLTEAFQKGATDSLMKPLRKDELFNRISFYKQQQEQQLLIQQLQERLENKERNYSAVSKQLRSSLHSIRLMNTSLLHTLGKDSIAKDEYELLLGICNETTEAALIWDNYQKLNNYHPDICKPRRQRVDINSILANIANSYQLVAQQKEVTLFKEGFDSELLADVDIEMFRFIIRNLLSNAIRYNQPGGHVILSCYAAPDDQCVVKIHRTGTQGEAEKEQKDHGWLLSNSYAEAHKGKIWFDTKEPSGTSCYFSFTC